MRIAACDRLVLVIGPSAVKSAYAEQEWRFAMEAGKCVEAGTTMRRRVCTCNRFRSTWRNCRNSDRALWGAVMRSVGGSFYRLPTPQ